MFSAVRWGLILGLLVEVWNAVYIVARWYENPLTMLLFFLVIPLEIVLVVIALRGTAKTTGYGGQVLNGAVFSVVAAVVVFAGAYLLTTVVFPGYFEEARAAYGRILSQAGRTPEQVTADLAKGSGRFDAFANAFSGAIGTFFTGLVTALVAGAGLRRRQGA